MSDRETRHLDEHAQPDDTDRFPPEWSRCELCQGSGEVRPAGTSDLPDGVCARCDGAGELVDR